MYIHLNIMDIMMNSSKNEHLIAFNADFDEQLDLLLDDLEYQNSKSFEVDLSDLHIMHGISTFDNEPIEDIDILLEDAIGECLNDDYVSRKALDDFYHKIGIKK